MLDLIMPALISGLCIAILAGPLGCFLVWRKMSFFGDSLSHGLMLGVAISLCMNVSLSIGLMVVGIILALILSWYMQQETLANDTILNLFSQGAFALGIIWIGFMNPAKFNLLGLLFGDVLAISYADLFFIGGVSALLILCLGYFWKDFLKLTLDPDYAAIEGLNTRRIDFIFTIILALFVAVALQSVGVLLINALLIIPAATARSLGVTPFKMVLRASVIGCIALMMGLGFSTFYDSPPGPAVVIAALAIFLGVRIFYKINNHIKY